MTIHILRQDPDFLMGAPTGIVADAVREIGSLLGRDTFEKVYNGFREFVIGLV